MLQKETLTRKRKNDLLQISEVFDIFNREVRVKQIVEQTGFSRKKVWKLLKDMQKAGVGGVQQVRKGVYKPIYPRLNELRVKWGGEVKRFTVDEFIDLLKRGEIHLLKEQNIENPAILWLNHLDISSEISNSQKEQENLDWVKMRVYEALKESKNPSKFRAYVIFGCLYWEEVDVNEG
jgi:biotin operon repressor